MDKYKEAIHAIKSNYPPSNYTMLRDGLDLAIEALEKQIPKPPVEKVNPKYPALGKMYYCTCGVLFTGWGKQARSRNQFLWKLWAEN